jgi:glycosyltransferase involved in cell wall biosynthesis
MTAINTPPTPITTARPAALTASAVSVVVPMYNEVANAAPLIDAVQAALANAPWPWELIVVDDGSADGTADALEQRAAQLGPHIRVIRLWRNFRQTAAMQAGIDAARGEVIVTLDGDLQNDPKDIPALVEKLVREDLDLVAGWRVNRQDGLWLRKVPSKIANHLIRKLTGLPFRDLGCSLKVYRARVLRQVRLFGEMHRFIPAWMATVTSPRRMAEAPVSHHARTAGASKYGLSRTFRVIVDLLAVHFFLKYSTRPGHFFGGLGLLIMALGMGILSYLGVLKIMGESVVGRPLFFFGFFCVVTAIQLLTTGVLAELLIRIYFSRELPAQPYYAAPEHKPADGADWHSPS